MSLADAVARIDMGQGGLVAAVARSVPGGRIYRPWSATSTTLRCYGRHLCTPEVRHMWLRWFRVPCLVVCLLTIPAMARAEVTMIPPAIDIGDVRVGFGGFVVSAGALSSDTTLAVTVRLDTGGDCDQFALIGATPAMIGPTPAAVTVGLRPTSPGMKTCVLRVNHGDTAVASFNVTGNGTAPHLVIDPGVVSFGDVEFGLGAVRAVTLRNDGNAPLSVGTPRIISPSAFRFVGSDGGSLDPGGQQIWQFSCTPDLGFNFEIATVDSNSFPFPSDDIFLDCTGVQGVAAAAPLSVSFGTVLRRTTKTATVILSNPGDFPLTGITAAISGVGTGYVIDQTTVPTTLAVDAAAAIRIAFSPDTASDGGRATLTITSHWGSVPRTITSSVALTGQGTGTGIDAAPGTLDFGEFRFDSAPERAYHIVNIGDTDVTIQSAPFTPDPGTLITEVTSVIRDHDTEVALPHTLVPGQQLEVTVTALPRNRTGAVSGHIDVHASGLGVPEPRLPVTGSSTAAVVSAPALVDFGAVDLDGPPPAKQTIVVTNTGAAALDIASMSRSPDSSTAFSTTLPASAVQLASGARLEIPVTYAPVTTRGPDSFDTLTLVANLVGTVAGPTQAVITVRGRGIDRHLVVDAAPRFPGTYPHPGASAPTRPVTVHNTGEAVLQITAVMLTGGPVWQLLDTDPVAIPGGASHDFRIRFSPTGVGPAAGGQLTLVNDDNDQPMAMVALSGDGVGRQIAAPPTLDLGQAGVGSEVTMNLVIQNLDPDNAVTVHDLVLDGTAFTVTGVAGTRIDAGVSRSYTVRFAPTAAGEFHAQATLYLDEDPAPQAQIALVGRAAMDGHGAAADGHGGCSTGDDPRGAAALVLILVVSGRRRGGRAWGRR
jgi:hypothetical protein